MAKSETITSVKIFSLCCTANHSTVPGHTCIHISPLFLKHFGIGHLKTRLLPDLKLLQNVPQHSLFKLCKFHEKINGQLFARGQNVLYNAQILRL